MPSFTCSQNGAETPNDSWSGGVEEAKRRLKDVGRSGGISGWPLVLAIFVLLRLLFLKVGGRGGPVAVRGRSRPASRRVSLLIPCAGFSERLSKG